MVGYDLRPEVDSKISKGFAASMLALWTTMKQDTSITPRNTWVAIA